MVLFVLSKLILQTRMRRHPVWLDVWFLVGPFVYFHTSCVQTAKALARLRECAGSPGWAFAGRLCDNYHISSAGSNDNFCKNKIVEMPKLIWDNLFSATYWAHSKDSDQTGWMPRLIWVFAGRTSHFVGFVAQGLICICDSTTINTMGHESKSFCIWPTVSIDPWL